MFAGAGLLCSFSAVIAETAILQGLSIGFAALFFGFMWFFGICYFRGKDPYRLMGLRPPPARSPTNQD